MQIKSFNFDNHKRNWHIEKAAFDKFNLLVGISGVGKTRIVKCIQAICEAVVGHAQLKDGVNWRISFVHAEQEYEWELRSVLVEPDFAENEHSGPAVITYEKILQKRGDEKIVILERSEKVNQLDGKEIPKLTKTASAINLLSEEASIAPIYDGFKRLIFSETPQEHYTISRLDPEKNHIKPQNFLKFKEKSMQWPTVVKVYWLLEHYPEEFKQLKEDFTDIFPSIEDIKISVTRKTQSYEFSFNIKENNEWIAQSQMSSGMFRTLVHLTNIYLAPLGAVIIIDEFENGLGINCMPSLTDFVMSKAPHLQFILTSHHPYIINNFPWEKWQLVTRKEGDVRMTNATKISQLQSASSIEKFIQLINLPEYEEGIL